MGCWARLFPTQVCSRCVLYFIVTSPYRLSMGSGLYFQEVGINPLEHQCLLGLALVELAFRVLESCNSSFAVASIFQLLLDL